jgi:hypothetical protein
MSTIIRILIGIGLFTFGYHLGREVGRLEPIRDELSRSRTRRGVTIEGEKVESKRKEGDD